MFLTLFLKNMPSEFGLTFVLWYNNNELAINRVTEVA